MNWPTPCENLIYQHLSFSNISSFMVGFPFKNSEFSQCCCVFPFILSLIQRSAEYRFQEGGFACSPVEG